MPSKDIRGNVKEVVLNAALAFELHNGRGEQWRLVFRRALNALPVKAGREYKFLVAMADQSPAAMDKVVYVLLGGNY